MIPEVYNGVAKDIGAILKHSQSRIALNTKQTSNPSVMMVMIHHKILCIDATYSALALLSGKKLQEHCVPLHSLGTLVWFQKPIVSPVLRTWIVIFSGQPRSSRRSLKTCSLVSERLTRFTPSPPPDGVL
jgi:hypothetical protein